MGEHSSWGKRAHASAECPDGCSRSYPTSSSQQLTQGSAVVSSSLCIRRGMIREARDPVWSYTAIRMLNLGFKHRAFGFWRHVLFFFFFTMQRYFLAAFLEWSMSSVSWKSHSRDLSHPNLPVTWDEIWNRITSIFLWVISFLLFFFLPTPSSFFFLPVR